MQIYKKSILIVKQFYLILNLQFQIFLILTTIPNHKYNDNFIFEFVNYFKIGVNNYSNIGHICRFSNEGINL